MSEEPLAYTPVTLEDHDDKFSFRKMYPYQRETPRRISPPSPIISTKNDRMTTLRVWSYKKEWKWFMQTDQGIRSAGKYTELPIYQSFLLTLADALHHYHQDNLRIETPSGSHLKRLEGALARIRLQDPRFSVTKHWEIEVVIYSLLNGKTISYAPMDKEWACNSAIKSSGFLALSPDTIPQIQVKVANLLIPTLYSLRELVMERDYKVWIQSQ